MVLGNPHLPRPPTPGSVMHSVRVAEGGRWATPSVLDAGRPGLSRQGAGPRHTKLPCWLLLLPLLFLARPGRGWVLIFISQVWFPPWPPARSCIGAGVGHTQCEAQRAAWGRGCRTDAKERGGFRFVPKSSQSCVCARLSLG